MMYLGNTIALIMYNKINGNTLQCVGDISIFTDKQFIL